MICHPLIRYAVPLCLSLCIGPHAMALTNQARATVSPNFSGGGGPVDIIHTNAGAVDASGSSTGGSNSSGDATAHTQYGFIRLSAHAIGSLNATATGIFQDSITITSPGIPTGTPGTLTYGVAVSGTLNASAGFSASSWGLQTDLGGGAFDMSHSGRFNSPELAPAGYSGDPFGTYSSTVAFQFGIATTLDVEFRAAAQAANSFSGSGAAAVDPSVILTWAGIHDVKANGTPVGTFGISSGSGTNWAAAAAPCAGDINNDGQVDDADFVLFVAAYNILDCADPSMPAGCPSDLNADGVVDDADFVVFVAAYDALVCP